MNLPTEDEIEEVLDLALESIDAGISRFGGMTYEEGVRETLDWIRGNGDRPME